MDAPPKPPHPADLPGIKSLKGHKPQTYALLGGGVLVAAWFIHKRETQTTPQDTTAQEAANMGQDAAYAPSSAGGYGSDGGGYYPSGGSGGVDMTGQYQGQNTPLSSLQPLGPGTYYDPNTGEPFTVYPFNPGATPGDAGGLQPSVPAGTGGGLPAGPTPNPPPVVIAQTPQPTSSPCPSAYPNPGTNPGSCYKVVCLKAGDGHGHGKGKWHVYRDGTWKQVSTSC